MRSARPGSAANASAMLVQGPSATIVSGSAEAATVSEMSCAASVPSDVPATGGSSTP